MILNLALEDSTALISHGNMIDFSVGHKLFDEDRSADDVRLQCTFCLKHDHTRAHRLSVSPDEIKRRSRAAY